MPIQRRSPNKLRPAKPAARLADKTARMRERAEEGDDSAMFWLAERYLRTAQPTATRLDKSEQGGLRYLRMAAREGNGAALLHLAKLYVHVGGMFLEYDADKALRYLVEAAESGLGRARGILIHSQRDGVHWAEVLADDRAVRDSITDARHQGLADAFIKAYRSKASRKPPAFLARGEGLHPTKGKPISVERGDWIPGSVKPAMVGVYERRWQGGKGDKVAYSYWDGARWSKHRDHPDRLIDERRVGLLDVSRKQERSWRGLASDPDAEYVTYVDPPAVPRPGFALGGFVAHPEFGSPLVRTVHAVKAGLSRDGEFLTVCGYRAPGSSALRPWGSASRIKVVDGLVPVLCAACQRIAFSNGAEPGQAGS